MIQIRLLTSTHESPIEAENLAFYGSLAREGTAEGVVVRTGMLFVFVCVLWLRKLFFFWYAMLCIRCLMQTTTDTLMCVPHKHI